MSLGKLHWHACGNCGISVSCWRHIEHEKKCARCGKYGTLRGVAK